MEQPNQKELLKKLMGFTEFGSGNAEGGKKHKTQGAGHTAQGQKISAQGAPVKFAPPPLNIKKGLTGQARFLRNI